MLWSVRTSVLSDILQTKRMKDSIKTHQNVNVYNCKKKLFYKMNNEYDCIIILCFSQLTICKPAYESAPYSVMKTGLLCLACHLAASSSIRLLMISVWPGNVYQALYLLKPMMSKCWPCKRLVLNARNRNDSTHIKMKEFYYFDFLSVKE